MSINIIFISNALQDPPKLSLCPHYCVSLSLHYKNYKSIYHFLTVDSLSHLYLRVGVISVTSAGMRVRAGRVRGMRRVRGAGGRRPRQERCPTASPLLLHFPQSFLLLPFLFPPFRPTVLEPHLK